jgi:hypothetical protein
MGLLGAHRQCIWKKQRLAFANHTSGLTQRESLPSFRSEPKFSVKLNNCQGDLRGPGRTRPGRLMAVSRCSEDSIDFELYRLGGDPNSTMYRLSTIKQVAPYLSFGFCLQVGETLRTIKPASFLLRLPCIPPFLLQFHRTM